MTPDKDKIRRLRKAKGWTQERLSTETVLSKRIVQKAEAGDSVAAYSLEQFAYALGVSVQELCKTEVMMSPFTISFSLANDLPEDVAHRFSLIQKAMQDYEIYKLKKNKVNVYYVPGEDRHGAMVYCYAVVLASLHGEFMKAIAEGIVPDFAAIAEMGHGEPSAAVKTKMLEYYGFDHDALMKGLPSG